MIQAYGFALVVVYDFKVIFMKRGNSTWGEKQPKNNAKPLLWIKCVERTNLLEIRRPMMYINLYNFPF